MNRQDDGSTSNIFPHCNLVLNLSIYHPSSTITNCHNEDSRVCGGPMNPFRFLEGSLTLGTPYKAVSEDDTLSGIACPHLAASRERIGLSRNMIVNLVSCITTTSKLSLSVQPSHYHDDPFSLNYPPSCQHGHEASNYLQPLRGIDIPARVVRRKAETR